MRVVPVRSGLLLTVALLAAAPVTAQPRSHQVRSGTSYTQFAQSIPSGAPSGDQSFVSGAFQPVENYDGRGTPAYVVSWTSYDASTGERQYAWGYAPVSAVQGQGKTVRIDFDTETMLWVGGASGATTWSGTFTPYETGPYSSSYTVTGKQAYHEENDVCVYDRQLSGSTTNATYNFEGTCGATEVPQGYPTGQPNGSRQMFRGTGSTTFECAQ